MILGYLITTSRTTGSRPTPREPSRPASSSGRRCRSSGSSSSRSSPSSSPPPTSRWSASPSRQRGRRPGRLAGSGRRLRGPPEGELRSPDHRGPEQLEHGAWLSAGLAATVLMTFLQMVNAALSAVERLLILVGPICLAAYALPATQRITNGWLKVLLAILVVGSPGRSSSSCSASRRSGTSAPTGTRRPSATRTRCSASPPAARC